MNKKAQAGLEYLMTYGWALILVVTVVGVLIFIVSTPVSDVSFRSSDPTKLMLKGATALADAVQIKLQNITGGKITITGLTSADYQNLTINGETLSELNPVEVGAGGELFLEGNGNVGTITITYTDYAGIERTVTVTGGSGGTTDPAVFDPGSGTALDPYNIRDCDALQAISSGDRTAYYQLTKSIDCSGISNFTPIGNGAGQFSGHFDGQDYTISGLTKNASFGMTYLGLFGYINSGASISNVGLTGVNITGSATNYVGGLVGYMNNGSISNSYSTGSIEGTNQVGGLVGVTNIGSITNSYSTADVDGVVSAGGLVGRNNSSITNSYSTGSVSGAKNIGGLVGGNYNAIINSYSTGGVSGGSQVGGLVGRYTSGTISNSYWSNLQPTCYEGGSDGCTFEASASSFYNTGHDVYDTIAPQWDFGTIWQNTATYPTLR